MKKLAAGLIVVTFLVFACSVPPTPAPTPRPFSPPPTELPTQAPPPAQPPAPDIRAIMKDCTGRGNIFKTNADGSWSCTPPTSSAEPAKPVFSAANCPAKDTYGGLLNNGQSALQGRCVYDPTPTAVKVEQTYYMLVNRHSQMCLTAQRNTWAIVQEPCGNDRPEQKWKWDGPRIALESQSGICVGYNWGFGDDNNALRQVGCSAVRPWTVVLVQWPGDPPPLKVAQHPHPLTPPLSPVLERGPYYYIAMSDGDCVDVEAWSHKVGHRIIHTPCQCPLQRDYDNQLWAPY